MTKTELYKAVASSETVKENVGLTQAEAQIVCQELFDIISDELAAHGYISIYDFGKFYVKDFGGNEVHDFETQSRYKLDHNYRIMFKPSERLKKSVK